MSLAVGIRVPRRGNAFSRWVGRTALRLIGWRHAGAVADEPKLVMIGAPHTTNFDGLIAILSLMALGLDARIMVKLSAFSGPLGAVLAWAGAVPIDRTSPKGVIEQTVEMMAGRERMLLVLAPEGTRGAAPDWKRGFYHIAIGAKVPVVVAACNYRTRVVTFGPPILPTGDYPNDLQRILRFVHEHGYPRHPERLSRPLCELAGRTWQPAPKDE
jgi:1-acyl-sn-glycerol-3-phosphate acyltransferase